jgi:predicted nucleotide-binding protein
MPSKNVIAPLKAFLRSCSGKSQSEILKLFLFTLIEQNTVSESGSILIYNAATDKLNLFNDDDFLFKRGFLKPGEQWQKSFDRWEGIAGAAFENRQIIVVANVDRDNRFTKNVGSVPVKAMVCAPIIFSANREPFGVVSFHNDSSSEQFDNETVELIETYVLVLANELQRSPKRLSLEQAKIFIVHGRDELALAQLKGLLLEKNLQPIVLKDRPKTGPEILDQLEEEIGKCAGGFILLTPDDEGRLKNTENLLERARQNVIFESGYLVAQFRDARRVCFLVQRPVEMPSDLQGLLYEKFETIDDSRARILNVLEEWQLISPTRETNR